MDLHDFFQNEVKSTLGCTEPGAVAYAAAKARQHLQGNIGSIIVRVSLAMFKNARSVGIPGTENLQGIGLAAALGAIGGKPEAGLMALGNISQECIAQAQDLVAKGLVEESVAMEETSVWVEVTLKNSAHEVMCVIKNRHDHIERIVVDGGIVYENISQQASAMNYTEELDRLDFAQLWAYAGEIDATIAQWMLEGAATNMAIIENAEAKASMMDTMETYDPNHSFLLRLKLAAGEASGRRMSGKPVQVVSSAGSGNHGIVAIIPVVMVARERKADDRQLAEALALSHLVCGYIKNCTGRLTPSCGCAVAAGAGAAAAIVRLYGGNAAQAEQATITLIAALLGMICDGAKESCALKVSSAAGEAWMAAVLAMENRGIHNTQGVISPDIQSLGKMLRAFNGKILEKADAAMVEVMTNQLMCV